MRKPVVGETLWMLNVGNAARGVPQTLTPSKVTKVGKKYFSVAEGWRETQFHLEDWREKSEYSATCALYESEQAWKDEVESEKLCREIGTAFQYGRNAKELSLPSIRAIHGILTSNPKVHLREPGERKVEPVVGTPNQKGEA